ncbi:NAD-dependent epimerase/dehydratase family protein [Sphingobacterium sp. BN32]|uniref:NAD-dependent epimerase/dehydratase family protein n=1 Tax=Sphingobacterium sp. BN32 TaxID=3058432 RepID=UPI00265D2CE1|nr:NAD-dependent epimerase/dehydratase family protein [Sphingobacterium sp. BN32]WKK60112.1 NAD-dependent epimerase/dehydratase family protein [Sphingobacterium sp. BN32]
MQVILGANGQIGEELARELYRNFTSSIRIVSRTAKKVNETDEVFSADLLNLEEAIQAVKGAEIAYFTLGLPMDSDLWERTFPTILSNVIEACKINGAKLVFFDNTYMYPQDDKVLTEETPFSPLGRKGKVRKLMADMLQEEIDNNTLEVVICRAPEFYGPGKTQSITNSFIFDNIQKQKKLIVPISSRKRRSLIWTPDASRATALIGNTPTAYGQTWHLPVDETHPTYRDLIDLTSNVYHRTFRYLVLPKVFFKIAAWFNPKVKELLELLPRYAYDNIFDNSKFKNHFSNFQVTTYKEGIEQIKKEQRNGSDI